MWRPSFWITDQGAVLLQAAVDEPYCCTTGLKCLEPPSIVDACVVRSVTRNGGITDMMARPIHCEALASPDGSSLGPHTEFPQLTYDGAETMRQLLYSKCDGYPTALIGAPFVGQAMARFLARITGVRLTIHNLIEETELRDVLGDSHNESTLERSSLVAAMSAGGVFLVNAREASEKYLDLMRSIATFVQQFEPKGGRSPGSPPAGLPPGMRIHDDFKLLFSFPRGSRRQPPLTPCRMSYVPVKEHSISEPDTERGFRHVPTGPNTVLVLMMFNVPPYEQWYADVVEATVLKHGQCVRITKNLEEWRTEMRRTMLRADLVLVDLSHPGEIGLSPNVIWELSEIQRACFSNSLSRDRLLCFARGLDHVRTREEAPDFVYSADVDPAWAPVKQSSMHMQDLLGLRIRRYDPDKADSVASFTAWLDGQLGFFVQGVPAPYAWSLVEAEAKRVLAIPREDLRPGEEDIDSLWLSAIAESDFASLMRFVDGQQAPSAGVYELTGRLVASVSLTRAAETRGYWTVAKGVIAGSLTLREHYFKLLATDHLLRDTMWSNNFRENVWFALRKARLQPADVERAGELAKLDRDDDIRRVAESMLADYLPEAERNDAHAKMMAAHLLGISVDDFLALQEHETERGATVTGDPPSVRTAWASHRLKLILAVAALVAGGLCLALTWPLFSK